MSWDIKILARVAVFAALVFIFSYFSSFIYNVNPAFFIVFTAAFSWGLWPGIAVGIIGFFLWSNFNPFGPAAFPLLISQLIGISFTALIGVGAKIVIKPDKTNFKLLFFLSLSGLLSGLLYHIIVDIVDAFIYQPFWPRLVGGLLFSLITIVSNAIIFPMFYPALKFLHEKENR